MTPAQLVEQARRRYNAYGDSYWSEDELIQLVYEAEMILATEAKVIEDKDTSITTVSGTRTYSVPSGTIGIKRVEYDGYKLKPIDQREDDALTLNNSDTTSTGTPQYYFEFAGTLYLRPIPDDAQTLTLFRFAEPDALTTSSTTLSTPTRCHIHICDFILSVMTMKDGNFDVSDRYQARWEKYVERERRTTQKRKRADGFATVKDEESLAETILGFV